MALPSPYLIGTIEDAIHSWAETSTGIPFIWGNQKVPQPPNAPTAYGMLAWLNVGGALGRDGVHYTEVAGSPPVGEEVSQLVSGQRRGMLSVNLFSQAVTGALSAYAVAGKAIAGLFDPDIHTALTEAGVCLAIEGDARALPQIEGDRFVARSQFDVRANFAANVLTPIGYIAQTEISADAPFNFNEQVFSLEE